MTVNDYQNFEHIRATTKDDFDCGFILVCEKLNKTPEEVDEMKPKEFVKLVNKFKPKIKQPIINLIKFETDATKINLGQFIEVIHWLKDGVNQSLHLVGASIWNDKRDHKAKADDLLNYNVNRVIFKVYLFIESFNKLVNSYKGLFEIEDNIEQIEIEPSHAFIETYGWIYSAKSVSEFLGITINQAYDINIIEGLNTLSYLKSKQQYDLWLSKKK
jgi:hypothetical protein